MNEQTPYPQIITDADRIENKAESPTPTLDLLKQLYGEPVAKFGEILLFNINTENPNEPIHITATINQQPFPYDLPKGYGLKGGGARNYILKSLGEPIEPPRDIDIVAITTLNADTKPEISEPIADKYMPEDSQNDHGVEITNLMKYFAERDFTINEVIVFPDLIIATPNAWSDLASKTIRPTKYEKYRYKIYETGEYGIHPKLALKALRLVQEFCNIYGYGSICDISPNQFKASAIPDFFLALQLDKAIQRGPEHAAKFFKALIDAGTIELDPQGDSRHIPELHDHLIIASNPEHLAQLLRIKQPRAYATGY